MNSRLWTRDFTIITLGSVVSMLGNAVSGFAIGLLALDLTNSTFFYALFMVVYSLPRIVMPMLAGPYLDRFSRKKAIYTLDFTSAGLYLLIYFMLRGGVFGYALLMLFSFIIGSIDSVYTIAYDSFYPNLVSEGNFSKAYSVSSMIYPLAAVMTPVAAYVYDAVGVAPLFLFNAFSFLVAAVFETMIRAEEKHSSVASERFDFARYREDFKGGIKYISAESGLLALTVYFCITSFTDSSLGTLMLPFFKSNASLGVENYTYVSALGVLGRLIGGFIHYRFRYPVDRKFTIAACVYFGVAVVDGSLLFLPVAVMGVFHFLCGVASVTSFNIRISSTQSYIPDEMRARFNGTFSMVSTLGSIIGQLTTGALAEVIPMRAVVLVFAALNALAVFAVIVRGREYIKPIYNRQV